MTPLRLDKNWVSSLKLAAGVVQPKTVQRLFRFQRYGLEGRIESLALDIEKAPHEDSDEVAKGIRMSYAWSYTTSSIVEKCLWGTIQSQDEQRVSMKLFSHGGIRRRLAEWHWH